MAKAAESNDSNKKTVPDILRLISVSEPVFSMVFPMNSLAGFSLRFLMLFSLTFNTVQCIIQSRNGVVIVQLLLKRGARFFFYFFLI